MKIKFKFVPLIIGIATATGFYLGSILNFPKVGNSASENVSAKEKINRLLDYISFEYVDRVDTDSIVDVTIKNILQNLDPYSSYISENHFQQVADDMRGNFVGIGISFYVYKDTVAVISTVSGGPAEKVGIVAGDRLLYANEIPLYGQTISQDSIISQLRGPLNSKVNISVYRNETKQIKDFMLTRKEIPLHSVDASFMINDTLGYIKINRFAESTHSEFRSALQNLIKNNAEALVLDLRDNPGGYIYSAQRIIDELLPRSTHILTTKNKSGQLEKTNTRHKGLFENKTLFVIVNEKTASASEIIAAALQDHQAAIIIGTRTYGKGMVQREMLLGDGSAVRLTVARYFTPSGRAIHREQVAEQDYFKDYKSFYHNNRLIFTHPQKKDTTELDYLSVAGGVLPDILLDSQKSDNGQWLNYAKRSGLFNYFIFEYLDKNRSQYLQYDANSFLETYTVNDALVDEFYSYIRLQRSQVDFESYSAYVKLFLKAVIAEQLFGKNFFEKITIPKDKAIQIILEL